MYYLTFFSGKPLSFILGTQLAFQSLSPAGKSLEFTWHISVSHVFPLIANINVFQL